MALPSKSASLAVVVALIAAFATPPSHAQPASAPLPTADQTDPVKLGWMVDPPPPADKLIRFADGSFYTFPRFAGRSRTAASSVRRRTSRAALARRRHCRAPSGTTSRRSRSHRSAKPSR
jgi:hypothetical protein